MKTIISPQGRRGRFRSLVRRARLKHDLLLVSSLTAFNFRPRLMLAFPDDTRPPQNEDQNYSN
jgi:hypothetical protein